MTEKELIGGYVGCNYFRIIYFDKYTLIEAEIFILGEVSQKEKDKYCIYYLYVESNIYHKWMYLHKRSKLMDMENRLMIAKTEGEGLEIWG